MSLFNDVLVRPTEISFIQSAANALSPVEVLVLNKSRKALRYKVLCTARLSYSLSKCKGVLEPGNFIKITIEVIQPIREHTRKDFFKIQFFSCSDDSLQGEKYISSNVWADPGDSSFQTLESDSCSSWPGRSGLPNSRAISLSRTASNTVAETSAKSVVHGNSARQMVAALMGNADRPNSIRHSCEPRSHTVNKNTKFNALPATQPSPSPKASLQSFGYLQHLLHFVAFTICLAGISLPMLTHDLNGLLHWAFPTDTAKQQTQISVPTDICQLHTGPYSSRPCTSCTDETYQNSYSEDDRSYEDDFSRYSHLAILSFKAAFANICGALRTMNALTVITNLSWFFLGLLVMHTRRRNL